MILIYFCSNVSEYKIETSTKMYEFYENIFVKLVTLYCGEKLG